MITKRTLLSWTCLATAKRSRLQFSRLPFPHLLKASFSTRGEGGGGGRGPEAQYISFTMRRLPSREQPLFVAVLIAAAVGAVVVDVVVAVPVTDVSVSLLFSVLSLTSALNGM